MVQSEGGKAEDNKRTGWRKQREKLKDDFPGSKQLFSDMTVREVSVASDAAENQGNSHTQASSSSPLFLTVPGLAGTVFV